MGKPAARQTDLTKKGGPIVQGSSTVLIGSAGGIACSACPGGVTEGHPVNPLLGAKVLPGEEDFGLPGPLPFTLVRSYSSYQTRHPAPIGLLGPGWWLPGEASVSHAPAGDGTPGATFLHDGRGRRIDFDALSPGEIAHSASEGLWLVRCGTQQLPGAHQGGHAERLARLWNALPAAVRADARITVATTSPLGPWWVFAPGPQPAAPQGQDAAAGGTGGHDVLHGLCDRFGRVQRHERHADGPFTGQLRSLTDGAGRRYGFELQRVTYAMPASHGWGADGGVRLVAVWLEADPHQGHEARPAPLALVRYTYTHRGELESVIDRSGRTVRRFEYGDVAHPGRMTGHARAGRPMTRYNYDGQGRVVAQSTPQGLDLHFDYTPLPADPTASPPQPVRASTLVTDGLGRQRRYVFSGAAGLARVAERIEADGARSTWKHDAAGRLLEHTDALGRRVQHTIDAATGLVIGITDAAGRSHRITHDLLGQPVLHQAPAPEGPLGDPLATTWEHDAWGRLVRHTDPLGHTTHYRYPEIPPADGGTADAAPMPAHPELPIAITDARGGTATLQWNALGLLVCRTDCSGRATRFHYDAWGRTVRVQGEEGLELRTAYDALGRPAESTDALGRTTRWRYTSEGDDLAAVDHPGGLCERFAHDAWGRVVRYEYGGSPTPEPQDGDPGTPAPPRWLAQHYRYDLAGRLTELHNENARAHRFTYDVRDRLVAETGFDGLVTRHAYDRGGQRTRTEDARHTIDYQWSEAGQLLARTITPLQGATLEASVTERFEHDGAGQLVAAHHDTAVHRHQVSVHLRRDRLGRILSERQEMRSADGALLWSHESTHALDARGAPTGAHLPGLPPLQWLTYGPGHVHGLLLDGEPLLHIERDGLHRPVALDFGASQTRWRRDALSRLQALSVHGTADAVVHRPPAGHPGLPALARQHHYDAAGRLARIDTLHGTIHHAYDTAGRLAAAHLPGREPVHYRYDPAGNPWQPSADATGSPRGDWAGEVRRHVHDPAFNLLRQDGAALPGHARDRWPDNRVLAHGPWRYRWGACGNLVEKTHADGRQTHRLHWDHAQRLVAHEQIDHATGERIRRIHHYDVFSRRIASRIERSRGSGPAVTERCHGWQGDALTLTELRDPLRPQDAQRIHTLYHAGTFVPLLRIQTGACAEPPTLAQLLGAAEPGDREQPAPLVALQEELLHGASDHTRRHLHSMGWDAERLQRQLRGEGANITHMHLYHCDHLGTPLALIDAEGRIDWQIELDPWGTTVKEHNPLGLYQPIRMQGQHDEGDGAGLFYNRHRYYDPGMGRYVSQDPIGLKGGVNNYSYAGHNPTRYVDPHGLEMYPDDFYGPLPPGGYYKSQMTKTKCGLIPPAPPGTDIIKNMQEAKDRYNPLWFRNMVKNKGPWDYKQQGSLYQDFGNFNYGATGKSFGFYGQTLLQEAGRAQQAAGTSRPEWGAPPESRLDIYGGVAPYGDDPSDQEQITKGIEFCKCMGF